MRHLRYVLIVVVCVSMSFGIVLAQDDALEGGTVRGLIIDLTPVQNPIEGVEVKIVAQDGGQEFITETNAEGNYKHTGIPAGRYLISISKEGYEERAGKPVVVVDGGDHFISLKMSKKSKIKSPFELKPSRMNSVLKPRIESLRQHLSQSIGERYDLDPAAINTLRLSIPESVETALEQDSRNILFFGKASDSSNVALIKMLLSHPVCKAAFTEHLSEAQLQDYLEFTEAREIRDRQAVVHWITATLDKELSLRTDQREKIVRSLLDTAENELFPTSMNALPLRPQQAAQLAHYRLEVSLDGVLSEAQSKVWQGLVNVNANRVRKLVFIPEVEVQNEVEDKQKNEKEGGDVDKKRAFLRRDPPKQFNIETEVKIVVNEIVIDQPGKQPWIEINADKAESPEQMQEIAEAKLAAHTELLGHLDERATRRLALVTKGVAQQYFEAHDEIREAISREIQADLRQKVEDGKMTREEAAAILNFTVKNAMAELHGSEGIQVDITEYPLYQQAIKDVLSEEAFAKYTAYQVEREAFHQQALRDIVVACMDMQLLLDNTQRDVLETSASQLIPGPLQEKTSTEFMFFQLFPQTVDFEVLTAWQQGEFERVFGPFVWRRR